MEQLFGPVETVPTREPKRHCRLRAPILRRLIPLSAEELAELPAAATALGRAGLEERAVQLRRLDDKLRAPLEAEVLNGIEPDLQALIEAEGLAMRPGPGPRLEDGLLALLRQAVKTGRVVAFDYASRTTAQRTRRRAEPYGLVYGNRAFLVGRDERDAEMRLWRLARMSAAEVTGEPFTRDPAFDLQRFTRRSFGTFQEQPVDVVLHFDGRVAADVAEFLFHPEQTVKSNEDGSMTVRFTAGRVEEMCWHLVTWGTAVTVEQPARVRRRLTEMCARLAAHHGAVS